MQGFSYTEEALQQLEAAFSTPRLKRYHILANNDRAQALRLYAWNTALSEAMFGVIQGLEVTLRNAVQHQFSKHFQDAWDKKLHPIFAQTQQAQLQHAEHQVMQRKQGQGHIGDLVSELNFGFWVALFAGRYDVPLWRTTLYRIFPKGTRRKDVYKKLSRIRDLRNRIAHHEPILDHDLCLDHQVIIELLEEVSAEAAKWINHHSRFMQTWNEKP